MNGQLTTDVMMKKQFPTMAHISIWDTSMIPYSQITVLVLNKKQKMKSLQM